MLKFALRSRHSSANGQAAWCAVYGLMVVLRDKGILTPEEIEKAILKAERVSPSAPGNDRDDETKELLTSMRSSLGMS
jgi:hypothetical protein